MAEEKKESKQKRPTAKKRDLQNEKRRMQNRIFKSRVKTTTQKLQKHLLEKNDSEAKALLNSAFSLLDKGVKKGIYKLNKASRLKSKLAKRT